MSGFLLYVLLLAFCVSGERGQRGALAGWGRPTAPGGMRLSGNSEGSWRQMWERARATAEASAAVPAPAFGNL